MRVLLADLGADVIKIEAPDGEVARRITPYLPGTNPPIGFAHATVNRNKRDFTLDMRVPEGRDIFLKLAKTTDIIVQNFRPGTLVKWGLGYDDVRKVKPDIVYVSISGWGQWGPDHDRVGYDPMAQAAGGFISLNGEVNGPPVKAPTFLCDDLAGLHGAIGAIAALRHRDQTGEGQHVDVSLLDAMLFQSNGYPTLGAMGVPMPRWGNEFGFLDSCEHLPMPRRTHHCRHAAGQPLEGVRATRGTARPRGQSRFRDRGVARETSRRMQRVVRRMVRESHRGRGGCRMRRQCHRMRTDSLVRRGGARSPRPRARHDAARRQVDGTVVPMVGPAAKFSRTPTRVRTPAPAFGAHTDELLDELGMDKTTRSHLREKKVIVAGFEADRPQAPPPGVSMRIRSPGISRTLVLPGSLVRLPPCTR